ncbi:hypothetical protein PM082_024138 [Marasmius tenuissimus]|nr:hypothetical protein PM082_024138 [Marasmius tenuissimus]
MQFIIVALVALATSVTASAIERRIANPASPANLVNCPPNGGVESCELEVPCNRCQITYGSPQGGHTIWFVSIAAWVFDTDETERSIGTH